jgi:1,4-dihydroxy-2-naphthoate polyprenyltransferase
MEKPTTLAGWARVWWAGARPRTLSAAWAPVLVGTAAGAAGAVNFYRAGLALVVALALQVGVNYANDYSDGVRGTDDARTGPLRITASGLARPAAVRSAATLAFLVAMIAGLALALLVTPWLLLVGVFALASAVLYTGGPAPYGYHGLGEVMVLVFFGFVATAGSAFVQHEHIPASAWWGSLTIGLFACAILLVNNIRDIPTDTVVVAFLAVVPVVVLAPYSALAFLAIPLAVIPVRIVLSATQPPDFIPALGATARLEMATAVLLAIGLVVS